MLYFVQTPIPKKRQIYKGLQAVYGLGETTSQKVVKSLGLLQDARGTDLRRLHVVRLKALLNDFPRLIGSELRTLNKTKIQRLINIQSYRGRRHSLAYPVRGQRTHTNARTQKKLYRRWLINTYEKPKRNLVNTKKSQNLQKTKKPSGQKPKKPNVSKSKTSPKAGKYKI